MNTFTRCLLTLTISLGLLTGCSKTAPSPPPENTVKLPGSLSSLVSATLLMTALDYAKKGDTATAISTLMAWWGQSQNKGEATTYLQQLAALYKGQPAGNSLIETLKKLGQATP